jgi:hypothetical protein
MNDPRSEALQAEDVSAMLWLKVMGWAASESRALLLRVNRDV